MYLFFDRVCSKERASGDFCGFPAIVAKGVTAWDAAAYFFFCRVFKNT